MLDCDVQNAWFIIPRPRNFSAVWWLSKGCETCELREANAWNTWSYIKTFGYIHLKFRIINEAAWICIILLTPALRVASHTGAPAAAAAAALLKTFRNPHIECSSLRWRTFSPKFLQLRRMRNAKAARGGSDGTRASCVWSDHTEWHSILTP